ncbi:MAG: TolC family protein [Deltaproteobacteria bacterium]|nr:TolC family protein [Deltaproteobacteria bacterium]
MNVWPIRAAFALMILMLMGLVDSAAYAEENILTLDQIVQTAIRKNPGITISQQEVAASRARVTQTTAAYLPQVAANTGYTRLSQWYTDPFTGKDFRRQDDDMNASVSVSQYLYDFGQTDGKVEQSRLSLSASQKGVTQTIADTVRDIKKSYYEVLKRQNLVKVNQESIRIQEEHLNQAKAFYQAGIRPKIDVTKSETEYANSRLNLIRADFAYQSSRLDMEALLGGPPVEGTYKLADVPTSLSAEDLSVETLVQEAGSRRPEIDRIKDQIKAAQALLKASQAGNWPSITANAVGGWENTAYPLQDYWQMGVTVSWPLFTGYNIQGKIAESRAAIDKLEASRRQLELQVLNEVSVAYLGLNASIEAITTSEFAVKQAQENMELADGRYKNGVGNAIEYSDAELALTQAKSNLVQASYLYHQQVAELDHAVGR